MTSSVEDLEILKRKQNININKILPFYQHKNHKPGQILQTGPFKEPKIYFFVGHFLKQGLFFCFGSAENNK